MRLKATLFLQNFTIIFIYILVCLVLFTVILGLNTNIDWVNHTYQAIETGQRLMNMMLSQETGVRGYLVTGEEDFLKSFSQDQEGFFQMMDTLKKKVGDNPDQVKLLGKVEKNGVFWIDLAKELIEIQADVVDHEVLRVAVDDSMRRLEGELRMKAIGETMDALGNTPAVRLVYIDIIEMESALRGYAISGRNPYRQAFVRARDRVAVNLSRVGSSRLTSQVNEWIANYGELQIKRIDQSLDYRDRNDLKAALEDNAAKIYMDSIMRDLNSFIYNEEVLLKERNARAERMSRMAVVTLLAGSLLATVLGMVISLVISGRILNRIGGEPGQIADIADRVARGDLNHIFDNRDRKGIYKSMGDMSENLRGIIGNIKDSSLRLGEVGEDLSATAEETNVSLGRVTENLNSIGDHMKTQTNSVEEVTAAMSQISSNIESLNRSVVSQSDQVMEASSGVEEMVQSIRSVSDNMESVHRETLSLNEASITGSEKISRSHDLIRQVSEESSRLQETNQIISGIASQTNLLAMNAAIEAAHAGEAGRGFSVVADEIRKLAESSSFQSREIAQMLKSVGGLIEEIVGSSQETLESFGTIEESVQSVSRRSEEVRAAMSEQSSASEQLLQSLADMTQITQTVKGGADEINRGSELVLSEVLKLKETNDDTARRIEEIASSSREISRAVEGVMNVSLTNREMVKGIASELEFFSLDQTGPEEPEEDI